MYDKNPPENGGFVSNLRATSQGRPICRKNLFRQSALLLLLPNPFKTLYLWGLGQRPNRFPDRGKRLRSGGRAEQGEAK